MDFYIYDLKFNYIGLLEDCVCNSIIWTDAYYECDDFEITLPYNQKAMDLLKQDYLIVKNGSDRAKLIEKIYITNSYNDGIKSATVKIKGRGAECLLDRRVVSSAKTYNDTVCNVARKIVIDNVLEPDITGREIDIIQLGTYPSNTNTLEQLAQGENVGELTRTLLKTVNYGQYFKFNLSNKKLIYTIYDGKNRTKSNLLKVEFSPDFDNFANVEYYNDISTQYNRCVARSGLDSEGAYHISNVGTGNGVERREIYADFQSLDFSGSGSLGISRLLEPLAKERLAEQASSETITGNIIDGILYTYGIDYNVGDIVVLNDGFGHKLNKRLTSMIEYYNGSKRTLTPMFEDV